MDVQLLKSLHQLTDSNSGRLKLMPCGSYSLQANLTIVIHTQTNGFVS